MRRSSCRTLALFTLLLGASLGSTGCDTQETDALHAPAQDLSRAQAQLDTRADEYDPVSIPDYSPQPRAGGEYSYTKTDIVSHDGIKLRAVVTEPSGPGPFPLIVMPSSWALNRVEYSIPARLWAQQGFVVVSFTSRGFYRSEGEIDICDTPTVQDVSSVIDWAGANTRADLSRVGAVGISYGGGASLLAAAQDPRIDAVASMSGWADLGASMIPNSTFAFQIERLLGFAATLTGKPGELLQKAPQLVQDKQIDTLRQAFAQRSAIHRIDALNERKLPVLIAHAWNDGAFPISQMLDFYQRLEGPKSMIMQPGDHATADLSGLLGLPNRSWDAALRWMKHHVAGQELELGPKILSVSGDNQWEHEADSLEDWRGQMHSFSLSDPWKRRFLKLGELTPQATTPAWTRSITAGKGSIANSGTVILAGAKLGFLRIPELISTALVLRKRALIWKTPISWKGQHLVGRPELEIQIKAPAHDATFFAYLYEEVAGVSSLITHAPITVRGQAPGSTSSVKVRMEPADWHLAPIGRLVLVIDTVDPRYVSESEEGELAFVSSSEHPAKIHIPLHNER